MVSCNWENPPLETTLSSVYMWKRFPYRPSRSLPCMIIHNPYWIIKCADVPLSLRFPRSFDHSGFCEVKFRFLDTNFCFKPQSRHFVTVATQRVVPVRRVKVFIWRKVVPPARVTLPAEVRQLVHPSCLAPTPPPPRPLGDDSYKRLLKKFYNDTRKR